jgi:hypothetical protein
MAGTGARMAMDKGAAERACRLWKGFLLSKEVSPELALIFCKGALLTLNDATRDATGVGTAAGATA